jgi:hypothetical protein
VVGVPPGPRDTKALKSRWIAWVIVEMAARMSKVTTAGIRCVNADDGVAGEPTAWNVGFMVVDYTVWCCLRSTGCSAWFNCSCEVKGVGIRVVVVN